MSIKIETSNTNNVDIYVFSNSKYILTSLDEKLEKKECERHLVQVQDTPDFYNEFQNYINTGSLKSATYALFVLEENDEVGNKLVDNLLELVLSKSSNLVKTLICLPFNHTSSTHNWYQTIESKNNKATSMVKFLYFGDVVVTKLSDKGESLLDNALNNLVQGVNINQFNSDDKFYPMSLNTLTDYVLSGLFSIGSSNQDQTAIFGRELSLGSVFKIAKVQLDENKSTNSALQIPPAVINYHYVNENQTELIRNSVENKYSDLREHDKQIKNDNLNKAHQKKLGQNLIVSNIVSKIRKIKVIKLKTFKNMAFLRNKKNNLKAITLTISGLLIFILPILAPRIAKQAFKFSQNQLEKGNIKRSLIALNSVNPISEFSVYMSGILARTPLISRVYGSVYNENVLENKRISIISEEQNTIKTIRSIMDSQDDNPDDATLGYWNDLNLNLNSLYTKTRFLEGEQDGVKVDVGSIDNERLSKFLEILNEREILFGKNETVKYAMAVLDNNSITPSGGEIKSLVVFSINKGSIVETQSYQIKDLDTKLGETVRAEGIMNKYFSLKNWSIADATIFSEYKLSAQKIEWFLDKSMDIQVNGVIAINENIFNEIMSDLSYRNDPSYLKKLIKIGNSLDKKEIQLFLNDERANNTIADLGWGGGIDSLNCKTKGCYSDLFGITEFSKDSGKDNIKRELELEVSFQKKLIKRKLTFFIENKNKTDYSSYLQLLSNNDSGLSPVEVTTIKGKDSKVLETTGVGNHKESGLFIHLRQDEAVAITYLWESGVEKLDDYSNYELILRKQPGVSDYPIKIKFTSLEKVLQNVDNSFPLTNRGELVHMANLEKDTLFNLSLQ